MSYTPPPPPPARLAMASAVAHAPLLSVARRRLGYSAPGSSALFATPRGDRWRRSSFIQAVCGSGSFLNPCRAAARTPGRKCTARRARARGEPKNGLPRQSSRAVSSRRLGHMDGQVHQAVAVAHLVVVPAAQDDEGVQHASGERHAARCVLGRQGASSASVRPPIPIWRATQPDPAPPTPTHQEMSLTKVSDSWMPALESTMLERLSPMKSALTTSSSVKLRAWEGRVCGW